MQKRERLLADMISQQKREQALKLIRSALAHSEIPANIRRELVFACMEGREDAILIDLSQDEDVRIFRDPGESSIRVLNALRSFYARFQDPGGKLKMGKPGVHQEPKVVPTWAPRSSASHPQDERVMLTNPPPRGRGLVTPMLPPPVEESGLHLVTAPN